jgi:hypothetical protein
MADATKKRATSYAEIDAEATRIRQNSAEFLWICRGVVPPKIPDETPPTGEQNPLRRRDGEPIARKG